MHIMSDLSNNAIRVVRAATIISVGWDIRGAGHGGGDDGKEGDEGIHENMRDSEVNKSEFVEEYLGLGGTKLILYRRNVDSFKRSH